MKKSVDIVALLNEAAVKEELAVPLYTSHITQALFWSGLPAEKQKIIIENLKILERDSAYHARAFKQMVVQYTKK